MLSYVDIVAKTCKSETPPSHAITLLNHPLPDSRFWQTLMSFHRPQRDRLRLCQKLLVLMREGSWANIDWTWSKHVISHPLFVWSAYANMTECSSSQCNQINQTHPCIDIIRVFHFEPWLGYWQQSKSLQAPKPKNWHKCLQLFFVLFTLHSRVGGGSRAQVSWSFCDDV